MSMAAFHEPLDPRKLSIVAGSGLINLIVQSWALHSVLPAPPVPWPLFGHCLSGREREFALHKELEPVERASEG